MPAEQIPRIPEDLLSAMGDPEMLTAMRQAVGKIRAARNEDSRHARIQSHLEEGRRAGRSDEEIYADMPAIDLLPRRYNEDGSATMFIPGAFVHKVVRRQPPYQDKG